MILLKYKIETKQTLVGGFDYQEVTAVYDLNGERVTTVHEYIGGRNGNADLTDAINRLERFNGNLRDASVKRVVLDKYTR